MTEQFIFNLLLNLCALAFGFIWCLIWVICTTTYPNAPFHKWLCRLLESEIIKKTC